MKGINNWLIEHFAFVMMSALIATCGAFIFVVSKGVSRSQGKEKLFIVAPPQPDLDTCQWYSFALKGDTTDFQVRCIKYPQRKENK